MSRSDKIHHKPPLCFDIEIPLHTIGDWEVFCKLNVTMTTNPNDITCIKCAYYLANPEARELERKMRLAKLYG